MPTKTSAAPRTTPHHPTSARLPADATAVRLPHQRARELIDALSAKKNPGGASISAEAWKASRKHLETLPRSQIVKRLEGEHLRLEPEQAAELAETFLAAYQRSVQRGGELDLSEKEMRVLYRLFASHRSLDYGWERWNLGGANAPMERIKRVVESMRDTRDARMTESERMTPRWSGIGYLLPFVQDVHRTLGVYDYRANDERGRPRISHWEANQNAREAEKARAEEADRRYQEQLALHPPSRVSSGGGLKTFTAGLEERRRNGVEVVSVFIRK